jgi:hypothetical protein
MPAIFLKICSGRQIMSATYVAIHYNSVSNHRKHTSQASFRMFYKNSDDSSGYLSKIPLKETGNEEQSLKTVLACPRIRPGDYKEFVKLYELQEGEFMNLQFC